MKIRTLKNASLAGKRVLLRIDCNIGIKSAVSFDDYRIRQVLPTIRYLLKRKAFVRILAHRGRPRGRAVSSLSTKIIARHFQQFLRKKVIFVKDPVSAALYKKYHFSSDILFFENVRFWPGEEKNSVSFARDLARWGDLYVNDAFSNSHRNHASVAALARLLPSYAGFHFEKEIKNLSRLLARHPARPFVAVFGGAKMATKLPLIRRFVKKADTIIIAGALANMFFDLRGLEIGKSLVEKSGERLITPSLLYHKKNILPVDVRVARSMNAKRSRVCRVHDISPREMIVDIGPESSRFFASVVKGARTIVWNGPFGYVENPRFARGTKEFAQAVGRLSAYSVVGGGDSVSFLKNYMSLKKFSYISTGGGAMLQFLAGDKLPGVEALKK